jgi:two-component system, sensor histidine kinase and response regulator
MVNVGLLLKKNFKKILRFISLVDPKNLTLVYILALTSIAFMTLGFQIYKSTIHMAQLKAVNSIRYIDRHAAKVEKIYGKIIDVQITSDPKKLSLKLKEISDEITKFSIEHNKLINLTDKNLICLQSNCKEFLSQGPLLQEEIEGLDQIKIDNLVTRLEPILESLKSYRDFLSQAGNYFEKKAKTNTQEIIYLDRLFCILLVILLLFQAIFIFRPAVRKLNEALLARSDFISRISHEIRNPMNSVLGMADILSSTKLSAEQRQYLANLQRSGVVLLDMLSNLVDYSSLEKSKIILKNSKFNLFKMIDKTTNVVSIQAHDKGLELFINIGKSVPQKIEGDVSRLEQVLINLLNNALKFTNQGFIQLCVERADGPDDKKIYLKFTVRDTGIGIEKSKVKHIFDSFVQEDSSIKRRFGGSGLGLAISKEIIELMDSKIEVESEKGVGTEFYFTVSLGNIIEEEATSTATPDEKTIVLLSGLSHQEPLNDYIANSFKRHYFCGELNKLQELISKINEPFDLFVDDSIGIINMINAISIAGKSPLIRDNFALIRSNFPKENMDLIRRSGYKKFLIKPFRHWHLLGGEYNTELYLDKDNNNEVESESNKIIENTVNAKNLKVLAVDDANDNLFLIREILSPLTKNIDFASNGLEAIKQMDKKEYDIVFMDIQMPVMDGYTAIHKIRKSNKSVPVYAVTAHAGLVEEKRCLDAGFTARLTKPIDRKNIYAVITKEFGVSIPSQNKIELSVEERLVKRLLPVYFKSREEDLVSLKHAIKEDNFDTIKRIGHRIKGSAKSYGFAEVGELSAQLEDSAVQKDIKNCQRIIFEIESILLKAKKESLDDLDLSGSSF